MADTGAPWNIPYVENADLVKDYPTASLALANAIASGLDAAGNAGIGSNVVQAVKTDTFSTTSASFVTVTGLSATITPSSATSKILIIAQVNGSPSTNGMGYFSLSGGNTAVYIGDAAGNRVRSSTANLWDGNTGDGERRQTKDVTIVYLDSPATTAATTYNVTARVPTTGTVYVNRSAEDTDDAFHTRSASSLTVIEVAA